MVNPGPLQEPEQPSNADSPAADEGQRASPRSGPGVTEEENADSTSVVRYRVKECYVYGIPPASSIGHRAELWDVDNWLKAVSLEVATVGDDCFIRLFDKETGDLFAECPLPRDYTKFHSAYEAVVDSSRYFALKIVDASSGRHAFIGLGFRDRGQASDFNAALDDHRSFCRRQHEAEKVSSEREEAEKRGEAPHQDLSLQGTIHIDVSKLGIGSSPASPAGGFLARMKPPRDAVPQRAGALLPPPPSLPEAQARTPEPTPSGYWKAFDEAQAQPGSSLDAPFAEDDWGDFEGTPNTDEGCI